MSVEEFNPIHRGHIKTPDFMRSAHDPNYTCACVGPQGNQPACPCQMRGTPKTCPCAHVPCACPK